MDNESDVENMHHGLYSIPEDLKENGGNQLFMLFHTPGPLFRNTSLTVEGTASYGQNGRPFAAINFSIDT
uniref:Uncharacterized protein n=1 Tax=Solanum lycopersicum TaxID=4081 RepID=A0A3Q7H415_SOLLC